MIRLTNVKKSFNKHKANEIKAIDNTSLELPANGLVAFLGNSGSGKTTLLNAIGGLDKVDHGDIYIDGERLTRRTGGKRDEIRNLKIGYIFQNYNLIEDATVYANVALVLRMIGFTNKKAVEERVMYILKRIGIDRYRNRPARMLSGGERQRVGIARALVKNPGIIIADEPTGNLDSANTIEVMNIIKAISKEKLVILVTHERNIAEFYADRIVEIVDGKVTADRPNAHEGALDYRIDSKIYLQDMPYQTSLSKGNFELRLFSDRPAVPPRISIVIKNNNLYIDTGEQLPIGSDSIELVDDHYKGLTKEEYEQYRFDYDRIFRGGIAAVQEAHADAETRRASDANNGNTVKTDASDRTAASLPAPGRGFPRKLRYRRIYGLFSSVWSGFKKVHSYSKIKKLLLLGFAFASMFVIYAASNVAGVTHLTDSKFTTANKKYLLVDTGKLNPEGYRQYASMEGVDYVLPGNSMVGFGMPLDDYIQSQNTYAVLQGSLADSAMLRKNDLIAGRLPQTPQELVIDKMTYKRLSSQNGALTSIGIETEKGMLGRILRLPDVAPFTIVGVSDREEPCIYADRTLFWDIVTHSVQEDASFLFSPPAPVAPDTVLAYSAAPEGTLSITYGSAPDEDFEVLAPDSMRGEYWIGSRLSRKVAGEKLVISGFYTDTRSGEGLYVTDNTAAMEQIGKFKQLIISPADKESFLQTFSATADKKAVDLYQQALKKYKAQNRGNIYRTLAVAAVIVAISLIEIYLMLRASFLSRIKEVGVLRAIGLKKSEIYRMFGGEAFAITVLSALPAMGFMAYFMNAVSKVEYISTMYRMTPTVFLVSFGVVLLFNLLAGLLPVFTTLRKTPAAILARNDVN